MTPSGAPGPAGAEPEQLRDLAVEVATAAAALVREQAGGVEVADTKSSAVDVVTEVDRRSEALLRELILAARPDDTILGEEEGEATGTSRVRWIVDPVDGTVNLLYGIPEYAVSVAAEVDGEVVAGAVVAVVQGHVYAAARGHGATKDGVPIGVRGAAPAGARLVLTGFGYLPEARAHQGACVARLLPRVRDIRRAGSCALDLCHLAEGLADAYVEEGPRIWDWAAGQLVVTEAGGRFALMPGELGRRLAGWSEDSVVVASTPSEWDGFVADLRDTGFVG